MPMNMFCNEIYIRMIIISGCHYKGNVYHQDDTWTDGCSYDCVCNDASNGQYQCKEK